MLCYKDQTWCRHYEACAKGKDCPNALTPEVRKAADDFGLPVYQTAGAPPDCYEKGDATKLRI